MPSQRAPLISLSPQGLFCEAGGFHIDPSRAVENALITHAHSDHARRGSRKYFTAARGEGLLRERIGKNANIQAIEYGQALEFGPVKVSFHPAGHILGSAQIRVEHQGRVWVVSGDYKRDDDPTCEPFEVVACDAFVTEATFGLPVYRWPEVPEVAAQIEAWWRDNAARGVNSVLYCYSLGKAQRLLAELAPRMREGEKVLVHDTVEALNRHYRDQGIRLAATESVSSQQKGALIQGALVLAPPGIHGTPLMRRLGEFETAFASGWMRLRRGRFSRRYDRSFVLSDHADWPGLVRTVRETGAREVYVMHGSNETLARYLREESGLDAHPIDALRAEEPGHAAAASNGSARADSGAASPTEGASL
jgi:putative mRNA 3-end processing factor